MSRGIRESFGRDMFTIRLNKESLVRVAGVQRIAWFLGGLRQVVAQRKMEELPKKSSARKTQAESTLSPLLDISSQLILSRHCQTDLQIFNMATSRQNFNSNSLAYRRFKELMAKKPHEANGILFATAGTVERYDSTKIEFDEDIFGAEHAKSTLQPLVHLLVSPDGGDSRLSEAKHSKQADGLR